ncbi:MAG: AMP-binding protein [Candidatus Ancaeobacter aquaticus]|nr:AMP-binding protein [Candidatus Ancaeobacter aquaticus]
MNNAFLLHKKLKETVENNPDKIIIEAKNESGYRSYTYAVLYENISKISSFLTDSGLRKSDRVALILENMPEWPMIYFGILKAGGIAVPIDSQSSDIEIEAIINDCCARYVFCTRRLLTGVKKASSVQKVIIIDASDKDTAYVSLETVFKSPMDNRRPPEGGRVEDSASIIYTSGTVGRPKGVVLTHKNFSSNLSSIQTLNLITKNDIILSILPLHHSFPFMCNLLVPIICGARIIYIKHFDPEKIIQCMNEKEVTILTLVPHILSMFQKGIEKRMGSIKGIRKELLKLTVKSGWFLRCKTRMNTSKICLKKLHCAFGEKLRFIACGGARLDPSITEYFFALGFTVLEGYGLTETSPVVTINTLDTYKIGSVGKIIPGVEVSIDKPDKEGKGEILVKGPNVMEGYYNRPDEAQAVIEDGWFCTGDEGFIDGDGFVYITGRLKEVMVLDSGKNIYPDEIESHYKQSHFIKEICVVDIEKGEHVQIHAVVVPDYEYFKKRGIINIENSIRWDFENYSKELPIYQRIMGFIITDQELSKTRLGKLKRYEVKDAYVKQLSQEKDVGGEEQLSDADKELYALSITGVLLKYLSKRCKRKVTLFEHLELDLGIDSLSRVEIISDLSQLLHYELPDDFLSDVYTVKDLVVKLQLLSPHVTCIKMNESKTLWEKVLEVLPPDAVLKKIELEPSIISKIITIGAQCIYGYFFKVRCGFTVEGKENLPGKGPFVLCANHTSYLDGLAIMQALGYRYIKETYFLGYREIFERGYLKYLMKAMRVIQIDAAGELVNALKISNYVLKNGKILSIFPEGERSIDGKVKQFKKGIGIVLKETNVQVVPVYIDGAFESWPRTAEKTTPHRIKVIFGKPVEPKELVDRAGIKEDDIYTDIARTLRSKVIDLKPQ